MVDAAIAEAKAGATLEEQVEMAMDRLFVAFGAEILKVKLLNTTYLLFLNCWIYSVWYLMGPWFSLHMDN